jgi:hypothetical protein
MRENTTQRRRQLVSSVVKLMVPLTLAIFKSVVSAQTAKKDAPRLKLGMYSAKWSITEISLSELSSERGLELASKCSSLNTINHMLRIRVRKKKIPSLSIIVFVLLAEKSYSLAMTNGTANSAKNKGTFIKSWSCTDYLRS